MRRLNNKLVIIALISIILGMLIATLAFYKGFEKGKDYFALAGNSLENEESVKNALKVQEAFRLVAKSVIPAVVNINTEKVIKQSFDFRNDPFFKFFGDEWFDFFFGGPREREFVQRSLGTGFIVTKDGYILSNVHVVKNATRINVKLFNGKTYKAEIKGLDEKTDIALLKIKDSEDFVCAVLGDSDEIEVGDWAIAIGNPFGLSHTFTVGIISAKGRSGIMPDSSSKYENYIQTDASINPGNSGGPLVNIKGEVIGINNAIVTPSGGNVGIGFAIPINMAKRILSQLKEKGKVIRGWLGITIQDLDEKIAKPLKLKPYSGVLVADVLKNSPADKAGLKTGDIIIEYDKKDIKDSNELRNLVADTEPGKKVDIVILRKGKKMNLKVEIGVMPSGEQIAKYEKETKKVWLGMIVENITPQNASRFKIDSNETGVIITGFSDDSIAAQQGLKIGDIIKGINDFEINNIDDYNKFVKEYGDGDSFLFLVKRGSALFYIGVEK